MASFVNGCVFTPAAGGLSDFAVSAAVTGWQTPAQASAVNGDTYRYRAWSADNTEWEIGSGAYTSGTTTLARTTILASSNAGAKVNFSAAPSVSLTMFAGDFLNNSLTQLALSASALSPATTDTVALGTSSLMWSDLFLASGAVVNIDNGNWVATHTSGILTVGTGDLRVTNAGANAASAVTVGGAQTLTGKTLTSPVINTDITIPNTGLHLLDTNASHDLIIAPGSDLSQDRTLSLVTGDAARTITLSGNPTLSDWFDQSVKAAANPQFATIELGAASDTTLSRGAAGFMAVEGKRVPSPASQATGDILYRGATEWERLAIGVATRVLTVNAGGTAPEWAVPSGGGVTVVTRVFTADDTYTPTSGMDYCIAYVVGAGGVGGNATGNISAAGGGGGGGTAIKRFTAADIGASQAVDVGTTSGASSSLGALISATGGSAGSNDATAATNDLAIGGAGGVGSGGDLNIAGAPGEASVKSGTAGPDMAGGNGGGSFFGGGGLGRLASSDVAGNNGGAYGGGGAGGGASGPTDRNGGSGAAGVVFIIEYIS